MNDRSTVNLVVTFLGVVALAAVGSLVYLAGNDHLTDALTTGLFGLVTGCVGLIGGLLARTDSIDVAGLQQLHDAEQENLLPVLQQKLDDAHQRGVVEGASQFVPAQLEAFEPAVQSVTGASDEPAPATFDGDVEFDEPPAAATGDDPGDP